MKKSPYSKDTSRVLKPKKTMPSRKRKLSKTVKKTNNNVKDRRQKSQVNPRPKRKIRKKNKRKRFLKEILLSIGLACFFTGVIASFFVSFVTVRGYGMVPTLRQGDKVLIHKTTTLKRFDLIAFSLGNGEQTRRVIGLPGETITYKNDTLYVNGYPVDEKFIVDQINQSQQNGKNYTENFKTLAMQIPKDSYFVLGDNRPYATDSRQYGLVKKENIIGKITLQFFPINEFKAL